MSTSVVAGMADHDIRLCTNAGSSNPFSKLSAFLRWWEGRWHVSYAVSSSSKADSQSLKAGLPVSKVYRWKSDKSLLLLLDAGMGMG